MTASRFPIALLGFLLIPLAPALLSAATFVVDDEIDAVDAAAGDGACATAAGTCSLRAAVQEANALPGADLIALPAGFYPLDLAGAVEDAAASGDLDVSGELVIQGAGLDLTFLDGVGLDRVLQVQAGVSVELFDLTIQNGWRPDDEQGGGIYNDGDLTLERCRVRDGEAWLSGGIANFGTLRVLSSEIRDNHSATLENLLGGGGIGNAGSVLVEDSTIAGNSTLGTGGGIGTAGTVELVRSTLSGNHAARNGGGIVTTGGPVTILNSTISGNSSDESGGGVATAGDLLTLNNVTIVGNLADADGNGAGDGGGLRSSGPVSMRNTILADNLDVGGEAPDCSGGIVSEGYNLIADTAGCPLAGPGTGDVRDRPAHLAPLGDHGGPTRTHPLFPQSPAIDAGSPGLPSPCEAEDQRSVPRPDDGNGDGQFRCDMGAFELPEPSPALLQLAGVLALAVLAGRRSAPHA